jgi:23S rRNA pseudouridine1911/1915/1917 synthase
MGKAFMTKKKHSVGGRMGGMEILYEDRDIIVVDKPAGLLTMGTATTKVRTAYYMLTDFVRHGNARSRERIFIVHRLDQLTSGVLVFARTEEAKFRLQDQWAGTKKTYVAVVHGHVVPKEGTITSYLAENKAFVVYSTKNAAKGKLAQTAYKVLKESSRFSLLEIDLLTGRKNQIRVHFAEKGHPVAGDRKYGDAKDGCRRLALHARSITFAHPTTGKQLTFEAKVPAFFNEMMGGRGAPGV